jgi:predicted RNA-binding Zn ribbon-like protein
VAQHWRRVDGLELPAPVAGHPALELVNTFSGWDGAHASDYLATYAHVAVLAAAVGVLPTDAAAHLRARADVDPAAAARSLAATRALRGQVRAAVLDPTDAGAVASVSAVAARAATVAELRPGIPARWQVLGSGPDDLERPVLALAWSAAELLTDDVRARVRVCPGTGCGWLFLDTSGRRRWCNMQWCGNRAKVRAHAQRQKAAPAP